MSTGEAPIRGACHCGAVEFLADPGSRFLVACNCSICRRMAALWLHAPPAASAQITRGADHTIAYSWGEKSLAFHSCKTCGCTTHWSSLVDARIAVNMRLVDPDDIKNIRVRHFDGADSWDFLD